MRGWVKKRREWMDTRPPELEHRQAYAIADSFQGKFSKIFAKTVRKSVTQKGLDRLIRAYRGGFVEQAVDALPFLDPRDLDTAAFWRKATEELVDLYVEIAEKAGQQAFNNLGMPQKFEVHKADKPVDRSPSLEFAAQEALEAGIVVPNNPFTIIWARNQAGTLIQQVGRDEKRKVRKIVTHALARGDRAVNVADKIADEVGLLEREADAVLRRELHLLESGFSPKRAKELSKQYSAQLLLKRGLRIARTETIRAQNRGIDDAWKAARRMGIMPDGTVREWIASGGDRTCSICMSLDGQRAAFGEPFQGEILIEMPIAHPNCRCTVVLHFPDS